MYIVRNKRKKGGKEYTYTFLAESYWDGKKSKKKIICNMSSWPEKLVSSIEASLKKGEYKVLLKDISVESSIDYGNILVILEIIKKYKIDKLFQVVLEDKAKLALLMIIGKVVTRGSKLGIVNWIKRNPVVAERIGINEKELVKLTEKDLYQSLNEICAVKEKIDKKWWLYQKKAVNRIYLYDITSFYFEGSQNELAAFGYDRDNKRGKKIITAGLITNEKGRPLHIDIFKGNTRDDQTVKDKLLELKNKFGAKEIVLVGDRGMRIRYNLEELADKEKEGIKYITGLTTKEIKKIEEEGIIQRSLFDEKLVEIEKEEINPNTNKKEYKRYVLCLNPFLKAEKSNQRKIFKEKFELELLDIQRRYQREKERCQKNKERIKEGDKNKKLKVSLREEEIETWKYKVRKAQEKYKMQKPYQIIISQKEFKVEFDPIKYEELGRYDGRYVFETTLKKEEASKEKVREIYKKLQKVERNFKDMKTTRLNTRAIFHRKAETTIAHILLSMFSQVIILEMEQKLYPWLKEQAKENKEGEKLSFQDAMEELKMIRLCTLSFGKSGHKEVKMTQLNERQKKILSLLEINSKKLLVTN